MQEPSIYICIYSNSRPNSVVERSWISQSLAHKKSVHLPSQTLGTHPVLILVMFLQNATEVQSILRKNWTHW